MIQASLKDTARSMVTKAKELRAARVAEARTLRETISTVTYSHAEKTDLLTEDRAHKGALEERAGRLQERMDAIEARREKIQAFREVENLLGGLTTDDIAAITGEKAVTREEIALLRIAAAQKRLRTRIDGAITSTETELRTVDAELETLSRKIDAAEKEAADLQKRIHELQNAQDARSNFLRDTRLVKLNGGSETADLDDSGLLDKVTLDALGRHLQMVGEMNEKIPAMPEVEEGAIVLVSKNPAGFTAPPSGVEVTVEEVGVDFDSGDCGCGGNPDAGHGTPGILDGGQDTSRQPRESDGRRTNRLIDAGEEFTEQEIRDLQLIPTLVFEVTEGNFSLRDRLEAVKALARLGREDELRALATNDNAKDEVLEAAMLGLFILQGGEAFVKGIARDGNERMKTIANTVISAVNTLGLETEFELLFGKVAEKPPDNGDIREDETVYDYNLRKSTVAQLMDRIEGTEDIGKAIRLVDAIEKKWKLGQEQPTKDVVNRLRAQVDETSPGNYVAAIRNALFKAKELDHGFDDVFDSLPVVTVDVSVERVDGNRGGIEGLGGHGLG